jgi:general secretion pathway protein J
MRRAQPVNSTARPPGTGGGKAARARGFTLIELLVAIFIAALMFAMGYGALNQTLNSRTSVRAHQQRLGELTNAVRLLEQDLVQLAPRPIRTPVGYSWQPALIASPTTQPLLSLTRGGWNNPTGLQRPGLQRVAYILENGTLTREYWNVLDPTQASLPFKREILTHVKSVTLRYMDASHTWQPQWPPTMAGSGPAAEMTLRLRPIAVEVTLETEDWGKVRRILEIPG